MTQLRSLTLLAVVAALGGCADKELILPGERLDVRAAIPSEATSAADGSVEEVASAAIAAAEASGVAAGVNPVAISLPGPAANADWTHRGGDAQHFAGHVALGQGTSRVWSADIGSAASRKSRITGDPIVGAGRVYTLDAAAGVTATGTNGGTLWRADLTPATDKAGETSGGGLAFGDGRVFATTGYGELVALDAASGAVAWRQRFDAGVGSAPTAEGGVVYVTSRDGSASALRSSDGKILWQTQGSQGTAGVTGASSPAVNGTQVIFPFSSGQLLAVDRETGASVWQAYVAGARLGRAYARFSDLTGDPVVANGVIYAGSSAGRLGAVFAESGQPVWSAPEGAVGPVQVAGGQVFLVNDEDQLLRLDAATGDVVWRIDLPYYQKEREKRRKGIFVHHGPVLAGGRLWVASSDGFLRAFDPASGAVVAAAEIPGGAASAPVVAGGTLYVVSQGGQLHAFR